MPTSRRDMLRLALLALSGCADAAPMAPLPPIPPTARGIDVHCHAFNARDLPIEGFVLHVVLEADPFADQQLGALVTFIALLLDSSASTADAELAALQKHQPQPEVVASSGDFRAHARAAALAMQTTTPDARTAKVIKRLHTILPQRAPAHLVRSPGENPTGAASGVNGTSPAAQQHRAAFLRGLAAMKPGDTVPGFRPKTAAASASRAAPITEAAPIPAEQAGAVADAVADSVASHAANQSGVLYFASLLTKPRAELVRDLVALPAPADETTISLVTPALIDFSYWLDDRASAAGDDDITKPPADVTPLDQQIDVMSAISAAAIHWPKNPGFAVHPFVSFCPWRQVADQQGHTSPTQFDLVKQAILTKGFVGVKIYPLMGFRPIGNVAADAPLYPPRLTRLDNWADEMNGALTALYAWCVAEDVPVMAHCSFSQYPNPKAGKLGGSDGWLQVLDQPAYSALRLNLAHCGGVWDLAAAKAATVEQQAGGLWPDSVVAALGKPHYPNLYADLSDYNDVLQCTKALAPNGPAPPGGDPSSITALARLVSANPAAGKRIMYGTDFMFLTLYPGTENYVAEMRDCLAPLLGMQPADLMGGNAARFLGLTDRRSGTRRRLDAFRGDRFLARWES